MAITKQQQEQLFKRLQASEFSPLREHLKAEIGFRLELLKTVQEGATLYRVQGYIKALEDLLREVTEKRG